MKKSFFIFTTARCDCPQSFGESFPIGSLTFPNDLYTPSKIPELLGYPLVSFYVCRKFELPEVRSCLWLGAIQTTSVTVPKAAMHKNREPVARQNQIRPAGQILSVQPKAKTKGVSSLADGELRLCIL